MPRARTAATGGRVLLVLDNLEHLLGAAPGAACSRPRQSWRPRHQSGAARAPASALRVEPLALDDADSLFLERGPDVNPRFEAGEAVAPDLRAARPASARARARGRTGPWTNRGAARPSARRRDSGSWAAAGTPRPAAHPAGAIAWSHDLLDGAARRPRTLAVFAGGWRRSGREVCGADPGDVAALVERASVGRRANASRCSRPCASSRTSELGRATASTTRCAAATPSTCSSWRARPDVRARPAGARVA